jgi:GTP cyclohydrolase I
MSDNLTVLLGFLGNEEVRRKLVASEQRIRKSFTELFSGYDLRAEDVLNEVVRVENYTGIVEMKDITFYSYCEHHFAPFFGRASVYYEPHEIITGLGKIVRLVRDVHARRLQIQETMTRDIALDLRRILEAKGTVVVTEAKHLCICSRGPGDDNVLTRVVFGCGSLEGMAKEMGRGDGRFSSNS